MEIRRMVIDDYQNVYDLWSNTKGMGLRSLDDSKEGISKFLERNPKTNFVAMIRGKLVGVIMSGHDGRRGYIYHTAVHVDFRGKGIGKELVEVVCKSLKEERITKVSLVVFTNNELGNKFWNSLGFEKRMDLGYFNKGLNIENR